MMPEMKMFSLVLFVFLAATLFMLIENMDIFTFHPNITVQQKSNLQSTHISPFNSVSVNSTRQHPNLLPSQASREDCTDEFRSSHLVTSVHSGRTGNRIFQLATLIVAADDACYTPVYPTEEIPSFSSIFKPIKHIKIKSCSMSDFKLLKDKGWGIYDGPIWQTLTSSKGFNWSIKGFRQSFKYFQHKKELVRSSFIFKDDITASVLNYFTNQTLGMKTKVGIHVRRGDYNITNGRAASSLDYLLRAMAYFREHYRDEDLAFIVASDDMGWCRPNLSFNNVYFSPFKDAGHDLYLLTQCDHVIVTIGTFGWMGAWLNETGTVIYDKMFPTPASRVAKKFKMEDYYPGWWIGM